DRAGQRYSHCHRSRRGVGIRSIQRIGLNDGEVINIRVARHKADSVSASKNGLLVDPVSETDSWSKAGGNTLNSQVHRNTSQAGQFQVFIEWVIVGEAAGEMRCTRRPVFPP